MQTLQVPVYAFTELSGKSKEVAVENFLVFEAQENMWWEGEVEAIKDGLHAIGFYDLEVYFSGFSRQGDGACFTGRYSYELGALKKIKASFPKWKKLHELAKGLQGLGKQYFYQLSFSIEKTNHRYQHENTVGVRYIERMDGKEINDEDDLVLAIEDLTRAFMQDIYSGLEDVWRDATSEESIEDMAKANDWLFYENGTLV